MAFDGGLLTAVSTRPHEPERLSPVVGGAALGTGADLSLRASTLSSPDRKIATPKRPVLDLGKESRLVPLQTWEGFVESIDLAERSFSARLMDLTDTTNPDEDFAEFDIDEVDPDDIELLQVGAVFQWIIGYRFVLGGRRERVWSLVFRRTPAWRTEDLEAAKARAARRKNAFRGV